MEKDCYKGTTIRPIYKIEEEEGEAFHFGNSKEPEIYFADLFQGRGKYL